MSFEIDVKCTECDRPLDCGLNQRGDLEVEPCSSCTEDIQEEYYDKGASSGYEEGYKDGQETGREDGYESGFDAGLQEGHDQGYEQCTKDNE